MGLSTQASPTSGWVVTYQHVVGLIGPGAASYLPSHRVILYWAAHPTMRLALPGAMCRLPSFDIKASSKRRAIISDLVSRASFPPVTHCRVGEMQICSLPLLRDDETLYSIAARTRLRNAARDDRDACRSLFGPSASIRVAEFPVNLSRFCEATGGNFGDPHEVLIETTLYGFFERIGGPPWRAAKWRRPVETAGYGLATLSNGNTNTWRGCAGCVDSDILTHGTSHWRRAHQLPAAFFCLRHQVPLSLSIAPNNDRHIRFLLPEQTNLSTAYRCDLAPCEDVLMRLSKLASDALFDVAATAADLASAQATMLRALGSLGLLTAAGEIRAEEFAAELSHRYGFLKHNADFRDALSSEGIGKLCRSFRRVDSWRRPQHNLLLIDWLFGSWQSYRQQCSWQSLMDCTRPTKTDTARLASTDERSAHRRVCLDFMSNCTLPLRSEFFIVARRSFQWLLRNDTEWFDLNFPDARYSASQTALF